ncbi:MAG: glycosyltransferase [Candidatus Omnitrophica bacterium]|nr:glycosyltransferase [Candidatus Omnitrophota bacterium]
MKIAQILPQMNFGGVERGVYDLVCYFKGSKYNNIVVSSGGRLADELKKAGITHYKLPVYKKSLLSAIYVPRLRNIINKEKIDIVHARSRVPAWISFFATRASNTHFVTTCHGIYRSGAWSEVMGWGKMVICPSRAVARHMREKFGVPEEKIIIIERWVDLNKFRFTSYDFKKSSNNIVAIGRISSSKGYEYLIEAFRKVVRLNPYLKLKIIGSPDKFKMDYFNHLKTLVTRFALHYNVQFAGYQPDIENILKDARMLVAPSVIEESFGRVIIEAFACGVPVLATKVGGFREIIENGKDGLLIEPRDAQAITDGILKILNDTAFAQSLTVNAKIKVDDTYTIDKALKRTAQIYEKTIALTRILVIKLSSLGDLILSLPSFKALRERFPDGKISVLTSKKYAPLLYGCPYVDEVITLDDDYKKFKTILRISKDLRRKSFDYIIDLQNSRVSHIMSFLSFPRHSFGYSLRLGKLLTRKIPYLRSDDPLTSQERLLKLLGITFAEKKLVFWPQKPSAELNLPEGHLIGINVSASARWVSKNWPTNNISTLIELINKNFPSYKIVLFGDESSRERAARIESMLYPKPINLAGKLTLRDLPQAVSKLKAFVTPDTATLHLAQSLKVPTIALFGPTDPSRHTIPAKNLYIVHKKLVCSSCYDPECKLREKNLCMEKIVPQEVFAIIKEIIAKASLL